MSSRLLEFRGHEGIRLVGDAWGPEDGPPVVFLHGGGQTRHAWGKSARALGREGWRAVTLDLRGHGDTDWSPSKDYSMEAFVSDLLAIADELGRPLGIVGASLGGIVGLLTEGELAPGTASSLVLVDIAHRSEDSGVDRIVSFMTAHPDGFATLDEAADAVAGYTRERKKRKSTDGLKKNLRLGDDGRYRWHWDPAFMNGDRRVNATRNHARLEVAARSLRVPTLLVRGKVSDVVSEPLAQEFLEIVPHSEFVDVSGAGHMVAGDENDAFTEAVAEFLRRNRQAGDGESWASP